MLPLSPRSTFHVLLFKVCLAATLLGPPQIVPAQQMACSTETTDAAMRACEVNRYKEANKNLQATYTQLLQQTSPANRPKLARSQAAWLRFRTANADIATFSGGGGTLGPLLHITALADMTAARTTELSKMLR